ncbi:hypothetical protein C8R45DRAFT_1137291 [Mycena sanguinolenta]|nr:hypothetical protein C8R45DRAFT_1137291 [Mycena sanguinolenta]
MTVREALAASKEIRNGLQDVVRLKNVKAVLVGSGSSSVMQWNWPRSKGVLIRIEMEIFGRRVVAIVDTGSELDVVRADVAALIIHRPVDMTRTTGLNDANGGRGQLRGFVHDVELSCGGVLTKTGLWVSQQASFELLLGRPWQRSNLVTIDEREEGTYLVFKDRETKLPRYELMAVPHEATTDVLMCEAVPQSFAIFSEDPQDKVVGYDHQNLEFAGMMTVEIEGKQFGAIVDLGSQINIMRLDVAAIVQPGPADTTRTLEFRSRNGSEMSELYVPAVELICKGTLTTSGFWIAEQVSFEIILGRPWHREYTAKEKEHNSETKLQAAKLPGTNLDKIHENEISIQGVQACEETAVAPHDLQLDPQKRCAPPPHQVPAFISDEYEQEPIKAIQKGEKTGEEFPVATNIGEPRRGMTHEEVNNENFPALRQWRYATRSCQYPSIPDTHQKDAAALNTLSVNTRSTTENRTQEPIHQPGKESGKVEANASVRESLQGMLREFTGVCQVWCCILRLLSAYVLLWIASRVRNMLERSKDLKNEHETDSSPKNPFHSTSLHEALNPRTEQPTKQISMDEGPPQMRTVNVPWNDEGTAEWEQKQNRKTTHRRHAPRMDELYHHEHDSFKNSSFGPVDRKYKGTDARTMIQNYSTAQKRAWLSGKDLHIRSSSISSNQTNFMGSQTYANGDEVYRAVLLNAEMAVFNPQTGEHGRKFGNGLVQLIAHSPSFQGNGANEVPRVSPLSEQRYVTKTRASVEERQGRERRDKEYKQQKRAHPSTSFPNDTVPAAAQTLAVVPFTFHAPQPGSMERAHFLTHPVDQLPPCDTSGMERVGVMRDSGDVVLKASFGEEYGRTKDPRPRPGTPRLPWILFADAPQMLEDPKPDRKVLGNELLMEERKDISALSKAVGNEEDNEKNQEESTMTTEFPCADSTGNRTDPSADQQAVTAPLSPCEIPPLDLSSIVSTPREPGEISESWEVAKKEYAAVRATSYSPEETDTPAQIIDDAILTLVCKSDITHRGTAEHLSHDKYVINISDDSSDESSDGPPGLIPISSSSEGEVTPPSPALATHGGSTRATTTPQLESGFISVYTPDIIRALNDIRQFQATPAYDENVRGVAWGTTLKSIDDLYNNQAQREIREDEDVMRPAHEAIQILQLHGYNLLDRYAMERAQLFNEEELRQRQERESAEHTREYRGDLASIFIDEKLMWVIKPRQWEFSASTLDRAFSCAGPGFRRVPEEPEIPPTPRNRYPRALTAYAREHGLAFIAALMAEFAEHPEEVNLLLFCRTMILHFIKFGFIVIGQRHWTIDIANLHDVAPIPLPILKPHETNMLRLLQRTFADNGGTEVARIADRLQEYQFKKPQVISHLLYSGYLDISDANPAPARPFNSDLWMGDMPAPDFSQNKANPMAAIITKIEQQKGLPEEVVTYLLHDGETEVRGRVELPPPVNAVLPLLRGFIIRLTLQRLRGGVDEFLVILNRRSSFRFGNNHPPGNGQKFRFPAFIARQHA